MTTFPTNSLTLTYQEQETAQTKKPERLDCFTTQHNWENKEKRSPQPLVPRQKYHLKTKFYRRKRSS